jgi:hypothetical protein
VLRKGYSMGYTVRALTAGGFQYFELRGSGKVVGIDSFFFELRSVTVVIQFGKVGPVVVVMGAAVRTGLLAASSKRASSSICTSG